MSAMEHLFMQIFDRKAWIEGQLKHQIQSYGESMAYNLLAEGKRPPPWLWNEGLGNFDFPDPKVPNGELLASGILNPLPWTTTPSANNAPFNLPTLKADKVTRLNKLSETCANCVENSGKAVAYASELCSNRKAEPKVVEVCSEFDSLARIQSLEYGHRDMENCSCGKEETTSNRGQNRSKDEHPGQLTRPRVSSMEADTVKELSAMSDSLHLHMDGCRVTRSRSRTLSNNDHLRKLSGHREAINCVKNDEYKAAERKSDFKSIPSLSMENVACNDCHNLVVSCECSTGAPDCPHSCLEMSSAVDSMSPGSFPLVEPKKLLFDYIEEFDVTKNSPNPSDKENHGSTGMSLSKWDIVRSAKDVLPCRDLEKLNGSESGISQYWKPSRDKVFDGVSEYKQESVELDDSKRHSHLLSGQQSVHLDVCSRSSLDYQVNQAVEDQCSIQLNEVLNCGVACKPLAANTLIEPKHFEIQNSRESGLNLGSADALESETKASYSANAFTEMEVWQSSRVSFSSDSDQAQAPLVNRQLHEYDGLPIMEVMASMEKANKVSCQALESSKLSEVLESESVSHHMSKLFHGPAKASSKILCGISKSAPSCSSSVTDSMLNSDVDLFSHRSAGLDASKRQSFRDPVKHKIEGQQTGQLTKETDSSRLQLMKPTHNDIFFETGETEASVVEAVKKSALKSILTTPMDAVSGYKMLVMKHSSRNSIDNSEISASCKLVGPAVPSNEAANCSLAEGNVANGSIMNAELSTTGKRSYTSATHSTQPTIRYFLRSSTSHEKSLRSLHGNGSVSCFKKNSMGLETKVNEICSGPEDVTEKSVNYHKITPDIAKTHNELPKARFLIRSLDSHDNASSSGTQSMKTIADTCEATWPKRRKIDNPSSNVHGTSPRLRIKHFLHNQEGSNSKCKIKGTRDVGYKLIPSSTESDIGMCDTALANSSELLHQNKNCCTMEGCPCIGEDDQALVAPLPVEHAQEETFSDLGCGILLKDGARASELINCELQKLYSSDDGLDSMLAQNTQGDEIQGSPSNSERFFKDKENSDVDLCLHMHDTTQFADCDDDSVGFDDTMPEFEGFSIDIPSITKNRGSDLQSLQKERIFVLEQLCKTRNIPTPVSNLSSKYRINEIPDVGQSLPSGLLERMDLSCALQFSDADMEHFMGSNDCNLAGFYGNLGADINGNFADRPYSHSLPSSTIRNDYEGRKPPLSPHVMKFSQKVVSGMTGASSEKVGSNPELICFRIDENSTIANENEHIDRLETSKENLVLKGIPNSANRKALVDVTQKYQNAPAMVSDSKKLQDRGSLESVNSESYFGTQMSSHLSLDNAYASNTNFKKEDKENGDHSVNNNRLRKAAVSLHNSSTKPRVSGKTNKRVRSQSNSGKECKLNNIISSISSFIPFVRSKQQAAAPLKGKKEIKIKALETAEAAKRLEEKKQNEREMRKIAAKLERERLEQENIRLLELKQKQKDEEKKKKEADIAARKRQREEEGKKEKERKRRCIEETRRQHKEQEEKSRAIKMEKEIRRKASDDKERMQKEMDLEAKQQLKSQKSGVDGCQEGTAVQSEAMKLLAVATSSGSNTLEAVDDSNKPNDIVKAASNSDGLQSYEISPYRDSDDEDDEDGIRHERKHVPLWTSRECMEQIILSKQFLDPTKIFCGKLSLHFTEVLPTRVTRRRF